MTCQHDLAFLLFRPLISSYQSNSISAQVIQRRSRYGSRSAGYGFVALTTIEAAQQAVEALNGQDLEGRSVIVEIAKPAEEKDKEPRPKKTKKRSTGRRGPKSVPGEVTDAEANGETTDKAETAPATEGAEKPKKKKKKTNVCTPTLTTSHNRPDLIFSAETRPSLAKETPPFLLQMLPQLMRPQRMLPSQGSASPGLLVPPALPVRIRSANPPRQFSSLPTSASTSTTPALPLSSLMRVSMSILPALFERDGASLEGARDMASLTLVTRLNKRRPSTLSRAKRSVVVLSPSRLPSMLVMKTALLRGMPPTARSLMMLLSPFPRSLPHLTPTPPQYSRFPLPRPLSHYLLPPSVMDPFRLRLEAERFKRGNCVFVP